MEEARRILGGPVEFASCGQECVQQGDVIVLASSREELQLNLSEMLARRKRPCVVIDCYAHMMQGQADEGIEYLSVMEK